MNGLKLSLNVKLGQQLTMTPQLQQAIRLLQMPVLELSTQIEQALAENVMLEREEPAESAPEVEEPAVISGESDETNLWNEHAGSTARSDNWSDDSRRPELADRSDETLREHLLWQLEMEHFSPREVVIGQSLVDSINEDGYLTESLDEIHQSLIGEAEFTDQEVAQTLTKVQALDPAGIGARDLAECIGIQLRLLDKQVPGRDAACRVAESYLDLVAEQDYSALQRQLSISAEELDMALALVRACHPRPGSAIQSSTAEYIIPDVYVRKQDGKWIVEVNRSIAPRLKVNQTYAEMLHSSGGHDDLRTQLQEARWLVRSLEIRHDTVLKVAMSIVERQVDFLEHGEEAMKPMVLRDIADEIAMHESTVSRVTSNKYMHTTRGVFELKYFFSSQLAASDGSEQSSTAIRAKIRRLIGAENPQKPLSDSKIVTLLTEEGIKIARRTIAKYRESLKIPPSSERRQRPAR
ncbi:MAG: RNA polymerase factor sigma-54 [Gammaproteobacteria bacterium]|jgi:RNA polymerase sigma-54 factor|nr:RNA polymerase factor sigma-54 [Chromatiales bacterium]MDP6673690.1 RNA polymerase factor sigma-54 [Gammaproteobacteria bacterium]